MGSSRSTRRGRASNCSALGHADVVTRLVSAPMATGLSQQAETGPSRLWETTTGQEVSTFREVGEGQALVLSSNGHRMALATPRDVRVWDATPGRECSRWTIPVSAMLLRSARTDSAWQRGATTGRCAFGMPTAAVSCNLSASTPSPSGL